MFSLREKWKVFISWDTGECLQSARGWVWIGYWEEIFPVMAVWPWLHKRTVVGADQGLKGTIIQGIQGCGTGILCSSLDKPTPWIWWHDI